MATKLCEREDCAKGEMEFVGGDTATGFLCRACGAELASVQHAMYNKNKLIMVNENEE